MTEIHTEVLNDTKTSKGDASALAKKAVAIYYYIKNGVSLGSCAQIAGMDKGAFIRFLGENGVSIFHFDDNDEFMEEVNNA